MLGEPEIAIRRTASPHRYGSGRNTQGLRDRSVAGQEREEGQAGDLPAVTRQSVGDQRSPISHDRRSLNGGSRDGRIGRESGLSPFKDNSILPLKRLS
jgi:hypothetical protein